MKGVEKLKRVLLAASLAAGFVVVYFGLYYWWGQQVSFAERDGHLIVENAHVEIAFSASDGGIAHIKDKASSELLSIGTARGQLWQAFLDDDTLLTSSSGHFSYRWNRRNGELMMNYEGELEVEIAISFANQHQLSMHAKVHNRTDQIVRYFHFPFELGFATEQIVDGLVPMLPGALLSEEFFRGPNSFRGQYPGMIFAPYVAVRTERGQVGIYDVHRPEVAALELGFHHQTGGPSKTIVHNYKTWIDSHSTWHSPRIVIHIGEDYPDSNPSFSSGSSLE